MKTASGNVALVTGGSRGLGRAISVALAASGHRVVVNYWQSAAAAEETVAECRAAGGEAIAVRADVCDAAAVRALVEATKQAFGPVEVLVANATGPQPMLPLEEYRWQDFQNQLDFFVKSPFLLMQETIAAMKAARSGRVILIGSEVIDLGNVNFSAYVAAKGAMVGLTRSWANEFGPWAITVNLVAPGWIPVERHAGSAAADLAAYAQKVPLRRQGVPADVGAAVAYLASEAANFVTGQCWTVNGGNTF